MFCNQNNLDMGIYVEKCNKKLLVLPSFVFLDDDVWYTVNKNPFVLTNKRKT